MILRYLSFILLLLSVFNLYSQNSITVEDLRKHVLYLTSPQMQGRKSGTPGDSLAALYVSDQFKKANTAFFYNNGIQYFNLVTEVQLGKNNKILVDSKEFLVEKDFIPFSFSASMNLNASVIFVGFGISGRSDKLNWNDYENNDVSNKWVMVLRGDPEPDNPVSEFIPLATDRSKALLAKDHGAAGILLVSPSSIQKDDVPEELSFDKSISDAGIPVVNITRQVASIILGKSVDAIDSIEKAMLYNSKSIALKGKYPLEASISVEKAHRVSQNVVAYLEGSDPALKNEYIVVGAHYDHLGLGGNASGSRFPEQNKVHNGADDNASGVASLIEIARFFSIQSNRPSRSLIFVAFGAEELGIIGAKHFVDNSPVPMAAIKAMVNIDMIGRLKEDKPSLNISGTGTFSNADSIIEKAATEFNFTIKKIIDGYGPSDHSAFYNSRVPVLFISTGAHSDYHTPLDVVERINFQGQVLITKFTTNVIKIIGDSPSPIIFADPSKRSVSGQYSRGLKVTLGIMPDVSGAETSGGMKVEGIRSDGPAGIAGMLKGDIITALNGLPVSNIYDYMNRLSKLKQGDIVSVEILRDGIKLVLIIQL